MHWNVQGIVDKVDEIQLITSNRNISVVGICEHWINRNDLATLVLPGFKLASAYVRPSGIKGGTAIFLSEEHEFKELSHLVEMSTATVCEVAAVYICKFNVIVVEVYRVPDNSNFDLFIECLHNVLNVLTVNNKSNASIALCGDFNVDLLVDDFHKSVFENLLLSCNLKCTVSEVTRPNSSNINRGTCIDNIAISVHSDRIISALVEPMAMSDHHSVITHMLLHNSDCMSSTPSGNGRLIRPIDDINIYYFCSLLNKVNWLCLYSLGSLSEKFDYFLNVFMKTVDTAFPIRQVDRLNGKSRKKKPKWYNKNLSSLKENCLFMYCKFKDTGQAFYMESYKLLRKRYKYEINQVKRAYYCNRVMEANSKSKAIWSVVKESLNTNDKPIVCRKHPNLSAKGFNDFFSSSVKSIVESIPNSNQNVSHYLNQFKQTHFSGEPTVFSVDTLSVEEVYSAIFSLSNSASLDVYCLNSHVLKLAAPYIVEVLTYLFNLCIENGMFPQCLKVVKVVPLFKKGVNSDISNYRPVSIIPVIGKVFEILLNNRIVGYLEKNHCYSDDQYGFRSKRSTSSAVINFMKHCINGLDSKNKISGYFYDMSKAFDTISHHVLLDKLLFYGFDQSALDLIKSYLTNRQQSVYFDNCFSPYLLVQSGVPQGSILGPTLFVLYVNDLPSSIVNCNVSAYMYADDLAVQINCNNAKLTQQYFLEANTIVEDWTAANSLCLNVNKTQNIEFSYKCTNYDTVKFLGLNLQSNVKWNYHVKLVCSKVARGIFMLRKLKTFVNIHVLKAVYFAHIHSHISYGIIVWGHTSSVTKLFILQKRAVRIMCNVGRMTHCKPLFQQLKILTVVALYILECLMYIKTNLDDFPTHNSVHGHYTRQHTFLRAKQCNFMSTINSFCEVGKKMYNLLPSSIKCLSVKDFKVAIVTMLYSLSVYDVNEFMDHLTSLKNN